MSYSYNKRKKENKFKEYSPETTARRKARNKRKAKNKKLTK